MSTTTIAARAQNPLLRFPEAFKGMQAIHEAATEGGLPESTTQLVHLRASQINGCSFCARMHAAELRAGGARDERIDTVAAWREAPYFTDAERVALAVTETLTRLADRPDPVSDELWEELGEHYDEAAIAQLLIEIGLINVWNRVNAAVRQVAGAVG